MSTPKKPPATLFAPLFKHPRELLAIVVKERDLLLEALASYDEDTMKHATLRFLLLASTLPEWVAKMTPIEGLEVEGHPAYKMREMPELAPVRDGADAARHYGINRFPRTVEYFESSTTAYSTVGALGGLDFPPEKHIKVVLESGERRRIEDVAADVVRVWTDYFASNIDGVGVSGGECADEANRD